MAKQIWKALIYLPENKLFLVLNEDERDSTLDYEVYDVQFLIGEPELISVDSGQIQLDASKHYTVDKFVKMSISCAEIKPEPYYQVIDVQQFNTF